MKNVLLCILMIVVLVNASCKSEAIKDTSIKKEISTKAFILKNFLGGIATLKEKDPHSYNNIVKELIIASSPNNGSFWDCGEFIDSGKKIAFPSKKRDSL